MPLRDWFVRGGATNRDPLSNFGPGTVIIFDGGPLMDPDFDLPRDMSAADKLVERIIRLCRETGVTSTTYSWLCENLLWPNRLIEEVLSDQDKLAYLARNGIQIQAA